MPPSIPTAIPLEQALDGAPVLRGLRQRMADSSARLTIVRPLLPAGVRTSVVAGPIEDGHWCLLVPHHAAAAKIRQLLPALRAALSSAGQPVDSIRIKVHAVGPHD